MKTGGLIAVGLGAIGLGTAVALVLGKKKEAEPSAPGPAPVAVVPGLPGPAAPAAPAVPSGGSLVFVDDVNTVHLRQGQYYRGRLLLQGLSLPPFSLDATEEQIAKGLSAVGFVDVRVYMNVSNLPSGWPVSTAQNTQRGTRWFQGQWSGLTADVPKPPVVEQVWVTASPQLVAQRAAQGITTSGMRMSG